MVLPIAASAGDANGEAMADHHVVHTPIHASWLNQVEIYFSVVQRKALTPNDFQSLAELEDRLLRFEKHYEEVAKPFEWKFTRRDLRQLLSKLDGDGPELRLAA